MEGSFTPNEEVVGNDDVEERTNKLNDQGERSGAHHRTPYRWCRRPSLPTVPFRYCLATASLAFFLLPGYSNLLYLESGKYGTSSLGGSCTSGNEWLWIGSTSVLLLIPRLDASVSRVALPARTKARPKLSLRQVNGLWYAASLVGPRPWRRLGTATFVEWLEYFGGKAAWPAMWNLTLVLLPATRLSRLLDFYYFHTSDQVSTKTTLVSMHTSVAWAMVLWLALHTVLLTAAYLIRDHDTFWEKMLPLTKYVTEGVVNFSGWLACVSTSMQAVHTPVYFFVVFCADTSHRFF